MNGYSSRCGTAQIFAESPGGDFCERTQRIFDGSASGSFETFAAYCSDVRYDEPLAKLLSCAADEQGRVLGAVKCAARDAGIRGFSASLQNAREQKTNKPGVGRVSPSAGFFRAFPEEIADAGTVPKDGEARQGGTARRIN